MTPSIFHWVLLHVHFPSATSDLLPVSYNQKRKMGEKV